VGLVFAHIAGIPLEETAIGLLPIALATLGYWRSR
jgi:hypothetical protein